MKLAKLLKGHGLRQGVAYGIGLISVEWHQTLPEAVRGLSRSMLALLLTNVLPAFYLFSPKTTGLLCMMKLLSTTLIYAYRGRHLGEGLPWRYALLHPIGSCVFIYAMLRSATTIMVNGGVEWRGTRYPSKELKASTPAPHPAHAATRRRGRAAPSP
jgi:hypothetical protein